MQQEVCLEVAASDRADSSSGREKSVNDEITPAIDRFTNAPLSF